MAQGFGITEETPDREYFTIVPNYIINHSTIWERDIYLIMKRIAGEKGSCFASHQTIAKRTGVSRPTISRTIKKLIKRGWIKEEGKVAGKTHPTKNYVIVDLWQYNSDYYKSQKIRQPQNQSIKNEKDTSTTEPKIRKPQNITIYEEEHIEEEHKNTITNVIGAKPQFGNADINLCIEDLTKLLGNKPTKETFNRYAVKRLITKLGSVDRVRKALAYAFQIREEDRYAPRIYNFMDLEEKLEHLKGYGKQKTKSKAVNVEEGIKYLEGKKQSVNVN